MRAPFAQIKGLADLSKDANAMESKTYREHLIKASDRGIQLQDEVLENARKSINDINLDIRTTYLSDLLNEALKFLEVDYEVETFFEERDFL